MSDSAQGPGWWVASDGKWYPPDSHPGHLPPPVAPPSPPSADAVPGGAPPPTGPFEPTAKPWWKRWWAIALGVLVVIAVIAAVFAPEEADAPDAGADPTAATNDSVAGAIPDPSDPTAPTTESAVPITEPLARPATPEEEPPPTGTRDFPIAIADAASITVDGLGDGDGSVWTLTVDGPGRDVTAAVLAENPFNEAPDPGFVMYGVPVTLRLSSAAKEPLSTLFNIELEFFGASSLGIIDHGVDEGCGVVPDGFDPFKEVFVGGAVTGLVCYIVSEADAAAGVLLTTDTIEGERLFLATQPAQATPRTDDDTASTEQPTPSTTAAVADVSAPTGSRTDPFAIGVPIDFRVDGLGEGDGSEWTLTVDGPGVDFTGAVLAENPFNEAPADGSLFYAVPVTLTLRDAAKEPLSTLFNIELEFFGPSTLEIIDAGFGVGCGVTPDGFDALQEVFIGGSVSGVVCLEVTEPDVDAGVLLTLDSNEGDRIFVTTR